MLCILTLLCLYSPLLCTNLQPVGTAASSCGCALFDANRSPHCNAPLLTATGDMAAAA